ncbi:hypothetical protein FACS1894132_07090 [Clostridia bacterium]|nr:hypothetical protein FACS1894132_07090 [Clostridia bacterium]
MKKKDIKLAKISEYKFRQLLKCFVLDFTATAKMTNLNRNTVNRIYNEIRRKIFDYQLKMSPIQPEKEEFEVDESYFGSRRVKGKRGRGAGSKIIVFGLYKRDGKVYTEIVSDCKSATLSRIIRGRADIDSVIYSDG